MCRRMCTEEVNECDSKPNHAKPIIGIKFKMCHFHMCFSFFTHYSCLAACDVIKDIQWSNKLDSIFKDNYQKDPTLSFQFFGSSTGFMRQFPGKFELLMKFTQNY